MYKSLCEHMFSFLLNSYSEMELLSHMISLCLTLLETAKLFFKVMALFYIPETMHEGSVSPRSGQYLLLSVFLLQPF